jgi:DNA-binding transcriptional LysR family regulator
VLREGSWNAARIDPAPARANSIAASDPAGVAFLPDARRILQLAEGAAQTVKRIPAGDLGTVVVGFAAASPHVVLPRLLRADREKLPDVTLRLLRNVLPQREWTTDDLVEDVVG